jgi:hypothetical protein
MYCSIKIKECRVEHESGIGDSRPTFGPDSLAHETCLQYFVQIYINPSVAFVHLFALYSVKRYWQKGHASPLFTAIVCREYCAIPFPSVSQHNRQIPGQQVSILPVINKFRRLHADNAARPAKPTVLSSAAEISIWYYLCFLPSFLVFAPPVFLFPYRAGGCSSIIARFLLSEFPVRVSAHVSVVDLLIENSRYCSSGPLEYFRGRTFTYARRHYKGLSSHCL